MHAGIHLDLSAPQHTSRSLSTAAVSRSLISNRRETWRDWLSTVEKKISLRNLSLRPREGTPPHLERDLKRPGERSFFRRRETNDGDVGDAGRVLCAAGFFTPFQFGEALEAVKLPHNPAIMNELQPLFKRGKDGVEKCELEAFEVPFHCTTVGFYDHPLWLSLAHLFRSQCWDLWSSRPQDLMLIL